MTSSKWIVSLWFIYLQLMTGGFGEVSWENCGKTIDDIQLLNLTISPDPILAPGSVSITITFFTHQNITSPLKATLALKKKVLFTYISVPCASIGSCIYEDLCAICTQCHCPMEPGKHQLNIPLTIESNSWMVSGKYQAEINLSIDSKETGCVKIMNIDIKTRK